MQANQSYWLMAVVVILATAGVWLFVLRGDSEGQSANQKTPRQNQQQEVSEEEPKLPVVDLQPVLDKWLAGQSGKFGVVVYDPDNKKVIASHGEDTQFFTASIYKLYAVYLALEDVQAGKYALGEGYKFGKTRQQCIHESIHSSDSPCAESILNEIGQAEVTERLRQYGLTDTSFPAFMTTAHDATTLLKRLHERDDLDEESADIIMKAMETQIYRDGLAAGIPDATVATKVGFSETPHYHETGTIILPSGRSYLVAFFSEGIGPGAVADFGAAVYEALK